MDNMGEIMKNIETIENENIFFEDINEFDKYVDQMESEK